MNSIEEKGVILAPSVMINCQVPTPTLVCDGVFCVLILEHWQVDFHMATGFPVGPSATAWTHGTSWSFNLDDTDEEVNAVLWSLSNPWSDDGKGDGGGAAHTSHCPWPQSRSHCDAQPHSGYTGLGPCLGTSHHATAVGRLAGCRAWSWLLKLNGVNAGIMEWRHPGPLGLMHPLVMAWAINCRPSPMLTGLVMSLACLPTQLVAPNSMNMMSHTSPRLSTSPNDHCP